MTFRDVAVKNFKFHIRRYIAYYLCSSFSIMIFFMYSTILFNDKLSSSSQLSKGIMNALVLPTTALIIFSVIFISYAHSAFLKSRQQEFGLFMSLGMSIRQIIRIIVIENGLVGVTSIISGILTGVVFSRLFFLIVLKVLQVSGIEFSIPLKSFTITLEAFTAIFLIAIVISIITAYRFQPVQLIKSNKVSQRNKISNPILALLGIIAVIASVIALCIGFASKKGVDTNYLLLATGLCLVGVYLTISQLGGLLLKLTRKRRQVYYKNLRLITGLDYRFRQTKKIIFITTLMVMITTFYCGFMVYLLVSSEKQAVENNIFNAAFIQVGNNNNIQAERLQNILSSGEAQLTKHATLEVIDVNNIIENMKQPIIKVMSVDLLNKVTSSNLKVKQGYYVMLYQFNGKTDGVENDFDKNNLVLKSGDINEKVIFQEAVYKIFFNNIKYNYSSIILLNNEDYIALKNGTDSSNIETIHLMNFSDWHKSGPIINKLSEEVKNVNKSTVNNTSDIGIGELSNDSFQVVSTIGDYTYQKQGSSLLLFCCGFLGMFFFIASSVILSFRLFSEIEDEQEKYKKLSRIGIRDVEIKSTINQELGLIFFIPVILGSSLSLIYIYAFSRDGGQYFIAPLKCNLIVSLLYFTFQIIYYFIVRKMYTDKIIYSLIM